MKLYCFFLFLMLSVTAHSQNWLTDFNEAKKIAIASGKPIVLVFSGYDWCKPCIKMDEKIWSTKEFKDHAQKHYIMLKADFPRRKKNRLPKEVSDQNRELAKAYNKHGFFPLVVILDGTGKVLGKMEFERKSVGYYVFKIDEFAAMNGS